MDEGTSYSYYGGGDGIRKFILFFLILSMSGLFTDIISTPPYTQAKEEKIITVKVEFEIARTPQLEECSTGELGYTLSLAEKSFIFRYEDLRTPSEKKYEEEECNPKHYFWSLDVFIPASEMKKIFKYFEAKNCDDLKNKSFGFAIPEANYQENLELRGKTTEENILEFFQKIGIETKIVKE
ncbi:MAG: hypothetical protein G01um101418_569 [Parcubacteria group bacterium Gr01-1014_18]|nr:MAG: hypothetical protein Greene041636_615 [Parcubacteria group bacterium Greene0416_36]TSC80952.1 MAG: hypothetical protein G01um101418_569 [Parcubacteria group bacterium Gr01-1014_18]TSC98705.1 MAG: hypothetical protein Greene101420_579 [Parcubacteria group bacterium Greene1014_20]TSD06457.1 MAG: hypothetical protein Greene07142_887 [Parcubacteria group bacterium Greene0714_2]